MLFKEHGISLAAASADPLERAREVAEGLQLDFPLGWGLDAEKVAGLTGAHASGGIVQPAAFLLRPGGELAVAVRSTWAIGRLRPDEVFMALHYLDRPSGALDRP